METPVGPQQIWSFVGNRPMCWIRVGSVGSIHFKDLADVRWAALDTCWHLVVVSIERQSAEVAFIYHTLILLT
jgi:hypothetical protein